MLETRGILDRELLPGLGHVKLSKLKAEDIDAFYTRLRSKGGGRRGNGLAPSTIKRTHGVLRRALHQGVRWGWLGANPATAASPPRVLCSDLRPPSPGELGRLLDTAERLNPELATFVVLSAACGARRSELLALRWTDIDLDARVMTIARGLVMGNEGLVEKDTKTHQARTLSLDATTVSNLRAHRKRVLERVMACGRDVPADAFVFSSDGLGRSPMLPDSTSRAFRRLCAHAGVEGFRLHDLRHYVATRLLSAGVDVRTVAGRLGHRNSATTLNVYAHFVPQSDRNAADLLGAILDRERSGVAG